MAQEMDDANRKLVRQRRRLQAAWIEVKTSDTMRHLVETPYLTHYRADDLIPEENDTVQLALKRLPPKEAYDRVFRLRRAFQVHTLLLTVTRQNG